MSQYELESFMDVLTAISFLTYIATPPCDLSTLSLLKISYPLIATSASSTAGVKWVSVRHMNGAFVAKARSDRYGTFELSHFGKRHLMFIYKAPFLFSDTFFLKHGEVPYSGMVVVESDCSTVSFEEEILFADFDDSASEAAAELLSLGLLNNQFHAPTEVCLIHCLELKNYVIWPCDFLLWSFVCFLVVQMYSHFPQHLLTLPVICFLNCS